MSRKILLKLNARMHIAVYLFASVSNILLSIPLYLSVSAAIRAGMSVPSPTMDLVNQYGLTAGLQLDFIRAVGLHQLLIGMLVLGVAISATAQRGWGLQYTGTSILFSGYVGYRMASRFLNSIELIGTLQTRNVDTSSLLVFLYWFALGAAISYVATILILRRSYNKLVLARTTGQGIGLADRSL